MKKTTLMLAAALSFSAATFAQTPTQTPTQQKTTLKLAKVAAPAKMAKVIENVPEMITKQPAGKLYKDMYGYAKGFISMWGMIYEDKMDGRARDFVVGDDGCYYMSSPITFQYTDSWIKGEKGEGDTIVFKLPQQIMVHEVGDDQTVNYYAARLKFQKVNGENQYVYDESSQDMKFVWRNDSLIKVDTNALLGMVSEKGDWNGLGDLTSETAPNPFVNDGPADPSKAEKFIFTFHPSERTTTQRISKVVIEGNDFYANNIDPQVPEAWIHGVIDGNKLSFTCAQYMGLDKNKHQYRFNIPFNVYYDESTYETVYQQLKKVTFKYDAKTKKVSNCPYGFLSNYGYRNIAMEMQVVMQPEFEAWDGVIAAPKNPTILQYQEASSGEGCIIFDLPRNNVKNSFMDQSHVYFNLFFDDELVTFYPDQYTGISEEMTDVPVDFADANYAFQSYGSQHRVAIYDSGFERVGVMGVYQDGDVRLCSDIVWSDGSVTSGIRNANVSGEAQAPTYYDLSGRAVAAPAHGVFIKKSVGSDGNVRTSKVVVK